ncbi:hypothetical protein CHARACLAT_007342 [Characodon lateralis]|uniref:Uncharacterized protein n=1 Tax=Characodon lateralis TaxID=208331 RepID=A0ABU7F101_9TELE|nr:hypothetical protein [Characodon lateralis]
MYHDVGRHRVEICCTVKCLVSSWSDERRARSVYHVELGRVLCGDCEAGSDTPSECKLIKVFHTHWMLALHLVLGVTGAQREKQKSKVKLLKSQRAFKMNNSSKAVEKYLLLYRFLLLFLFC